MKKEKETDFCKIDKDQKKNGASDVKGTFPNIIHCCVGLSVVLSIFYVYLGTIIELPATKIVGGITLAVLIIIGFISIKICKPNKEDVKEFLLYAIFYSIGIGVIILLSYAIFHNIQLI